MIIMSEFFNVEKIYYEGAKPKNSFAFKHYNPNEKIGKSTMRKQLRCVCLRYCVRGDL